MPQNLSVSVMCASPISLVTNAVLVQLVCQYVYGFSSVFKYFLQVLVIGTTQNHVCRIGLLWFCYKFGEKNSPNPGTCQNSVRRSFRISGYSSPSSATAKWAKDGGCRCHISPRPFRDENALYPVEGLLKGGLLTYQHVKEPPGCGKYIECSMRLPIQKTGCLVWGGWKLTP